MQLNETLVSVKEFHTKDRMSEAKTYLAQLEDLKDKVQGFLEEVLTISYPSPHNRPVPETSTFFLQFSRLDRYITKGTLRKKPRSV